jgi:hypothetical protein
MNQWYSKILGDGVEANEPTHLIQEAFIPLFSAAGQPINMAVFSRYDLEKNIVTVYFSPGASVLAKMFSAQLCEKPIKENGLGLIVGDQRCLQLFYPATE